MHVALLATSRASLMTCFQPSLGLKLEWKMGGGQARYQPPNTHFHTSPTFLVLPFLLVLGHSHVPPLVSYSMSLNTASDSRPPLLPSYLCSTVLDFFFKAFVILPGNLFYLRWQLQLCLNYGTCTCMRMHVSVCVCVYMCVREGKGGIKAHPVHQFACTRHVCSQSQVSIEANAVFHCYSVWVYNH